MNKLATFQKLEDIALSKEIFSESSRNSVRDLMKDGIKILEKLKYDFNRIDSIPKDLLNLFDDSLMHFYGAKVLLNLNIDELTNIPLKKAETFFIQHYKDMFFKYTEPDVSEKVKNKSQYFSLIFADIDNFKNFNNDYKHEIGDKVLINVADRLKRSIKEKDGIIPLTYEDVCNIRNDCDINSSYKNQTYISREGGEEIVILLPETDEEGAKTVADRLVNKIRMPFPIESDGQNYNISITISIGVSTAKYNFDGSDKTCNVIDIKNKYLKLLEKADNALYYTKLNGKNGFSVFDSCIDYCEVRNAYKNLKS
jgi:diguanylate cyclase (GGDEF)-like protein